MVSELKKFLNHVYSESSVDDLNKQTKQSRMVFTTQCLKFSNLRIGEVFTMVQIDYLSFPQYKFAKLNNIPIMDRLEYKVEFLGLNGFFNGYEFIIDKQCKFKFKTIEEDDNFFLYADEFLNFYTRETSFLTFYSSLRLCCIKNKVTSLKDKLEQI